MTKVVVADTGPLIAMALVELLQVLPRLFTEVHVPPGVLEEATADGAKTGAQAIRRAVDEGWIKVHAVELGAVFKEIADLLDQGEAEALALAKHLNAVALVDERRGRKVAATQGIAVTGTAAVLIKAKGIGAIQSVEPLLRKLRDHGYRLADSLVREVLVRVGERPDEYRS